MTDDPMRELARRLFAPEGRPEPEPAEPTPAESGNHSPQEGKTPQINEDPMRTYARGLFERAHND